MGIPNLADVLSPSSNGRTSLFSAPPQKSPEFERFEGATLRKALAENRNMDRVNAALDCTRVIVGTYNDRNRKAYSLATAMFMVRENEYWKEVEIEDLGRTCASFAEYIERVYPAKRATAFRYAKVGAFLDTLNVLSMDFEESFYEEHGLDRLLILDKDGEVNQAATREANRITSRINYMDMSEICSLYDREHISSSQCRELMAKSVLLDEDNFKKAVREARGETNPMTEEEKILDAGFEISGMVLPLRQGYTRDDIINEFGLLAASVKAGLMDESLALVQGKQIKPVASKSTRYIVSEGFKFIAI